jgi:hypothetical protein
MLLLACMMVIVGLKDLLVSIITKPFAPATKIVLANRSVSVINPLFLATCKPPLYAAYPEFKADA